MKEVFQSCKKILKPTGELHILLHRSQKNSWNVSYDDWSCTQQRILHGLELFRVFPGYIARNTNGIKWFPKRSALYLFQPKH